MKKIYFKTIPVYIQRYVRWRAWDYYTCKIPYSIRAKALGIHTTTIYKIMAMKLLPTKDTARKLDILTCGALKYADTMLEVQSIRDFSKEKNKELGNLKQKIRQKKDRYERTVQYQEISKRLKDETTFETPAHIKQWYHVKNINDNTALPQNPQKNVLDQLDLTLEIEKC